MGTKSSVAAIFAILSALVACSEATSHAQSIRVWIETPQQEYRFCQNAYVYVFAENLADTSVHLPYVDGLDFANGELIKLVLLKNGIDTMEHTGIIAERAKSDLVELQPNDTIMFTFGVLGEWGRGGRATRFPPCLGPGEYSVYAEYMRVAAAAPCTFTIAKVTADEEEQLDILSKAWNSRLKGKARFDNYVDAAQRLRNTEFASTAAGIVLSLMSAKYLSLDERITLATDFITNFPDDGAAQNAFRFIAQNSATGNNVRIIRSIPEAKSSKYLRNMLKAECFRKGWGELYREVMR